MLWRPLLEFLEPIVFSGGTTFFVSNIFLSVADDELMYVLATFWGILGPYFVRPSGETPPLPA
jgi:hypothetical protein